MVVLLHFGNEVWNEIKENYKYLEFTEHPNNYSIMGIGILIINK